MIFSRKSWKIILQDLAKDHLVEQDVMDIVMHDLYHEFYEDDVMVRNSNNDNF